MEQTGHDEMRHVVWLLTEAAIKTLPQVRGRKTSSKYKDATLGGKYLGYWWSGDLLASCPMEENIQKAR